MNIYAVTRIGQQKAQCDDSILIDDIILNHQTKTINKDTFRCICIADGVGGNNGGKDASQFVLSKISSLNIETFDEQMLRNELLKINQELIDYGYSTEDKHQMATTMTGIFKVKNKYYLAHIGNTRLYVKQGRYLKQLSLDHSYYQFLINRNMYKEAELVNKSAIIGCFGGGNVNYASVLDVHEILAEGIPELLILTTDGIHDYIDIDDLEEWVSKFDGENEFDNIINCSEFHGSKDDKSIVVIKNI